MVTIHPKVSSTAIAGAASVVLLWVAQQAWGINPPADVAAAFTTILGFLAGWLTPA